MHIDTITIQKGRHLRRMNPCRFKFSYRFSADRLLSGVVEGDMLKNLPDVVFNLRNLNAGLYNRQTSRLIFFDIVYGQFTVNAPEILFSGSDSQTGSFFCFNYRGDEATVFDGSRGDWLASGWEPYSWHVQPIALSDSLEGVSSLSHLATPHFFKTSYSPPYGETQPRSDIAALPYSEAYPYSDFRSA